MEEELYKEIFLPLKRWLQKFHDTAPCIPGHGANVGQREAVGAQAAVDVIKSKGGVKRSFGHDSGTEE